MQGLADKLGEQEWSLLAHGPGKNDSNADSLTHIKPELPSAQRHSAQENTSVSIRVGNTSSQKSEPEVSRATLVGKNSTKFSGPTASRPTKRKYVNTLDQCTRKWLLSGLTRVRWRRKTYQRMCTSCL